PVPLVDRGPEPGAEAAFGLQLDAVLLGERNRERRAGDVAALDQDRTEQPARLLLFLERAQKLLGRDEALFHEQLTQGPPGLLRSFHPPCIGASALRLQGGLS